MKANRLILINKFNELPFLDRKYFGFKVLSALCEEDLQFTKDDYQDIYYILIDNQKFGDEEFKGIMPDIETLKSFIGVVLESVEIKSTGNTIEVENKKVVYNQEVVNINTDRGVLQLGISNKHDGTCDHEVFVIKNLLI